MQNFLFTSDIFKGSRYEKGHPLDMDRVWPSVELIRLMGWVKEDQIIKNSPADISELIKFHDIDYVKALKKAEEDIANENKGLAANSDALGKEEKGLQEDPEERDDDDSEENSENNEEVEEDNNPNSFLESIENAPPPPPEVLQQQEEAGERMTAINDAFFKLQDGTITQDQYDEIVAKNKQSKEVSVLTAPVAPNREDFPKTKEGMKAYLTAYKTYNIQRKEFKKQQKSLIQPSESNKNGLNALNKTDGLTNANGSGSTTVVYQRQVVEVAVPVQV